ncbi:TORTIFOLIA1-like protein 3 [Rhododendron vialii]|uniref:TORTIFOLIA1-like protein 3 n=1 Tax=Rhododendron vialii TaxID=182163 RepID=UPI00265E5D64|nr:TORTIFOLIA1-like protein 3 [Rhododendron vialii]XP_058228171.1 TORTIFOLIA1-like protein 3 [Rhododendron vialii]
MAALSKSQAAASTRDLNHRVLACLHKLSDRDTHSAAAAELEAIAKTLPPSAIPPFLSSISATDPSDRSPVRKQCVRLISLLSASHGNALSPHLSKLLAAVLRRLRDADSAVRLACVAAVSSISSHVTKPPFTSIVKPLVDALVTEQDYNAQTSAALCVAAAIDSAPDPDVVYLRKVLLPKAEKLLRSNNGFKAKAAGLAVVGSVVGVGAVSGRETVGKLVGCLVGFLGSEDWAARKAAAEALVKLAAVEADEGESLAELKAACLKTFEARRFDKVKVVRETMNQLVEAWKGIADVEGEASPPLPTEPQSSPKDNATDRQHLPGSKTSRTSISGPPQERKKSIPGNRSALPDGSVSTTARKRSSLDTSDKKSGQAMFRKLDRKKPTDWKVEISSNHSPSMTVVCEDDPRGRYEKGEKLRSQVMISETRRALFDRNADDKMFKFGGAKAGSQVVPCEGDNSASTVGVSEITENVCKNQKESEDLSLIRKQLVQIENQQSGLLDLLQNFIGSSQNGMRSLETRVQGFELALNEISYDLAVTNGRMSNMDSKRTSCCSLPGAEFLSPKFWRRTAPRRHSISQFSSSRVTPPMAAIRDLADRNGNAETFKLENRRFRGQSSGGFIVNPLAEVRSDSHGISEVSSNRVSKNVQNAS